MNAAKTNINTIAKLAEVSTTTVSNFINATETLPISQEKRGRIMEAMRQTNYRPSAASGNLRRNSVLPDKAVFIFGDNAQSNPFNTCKDPMLGELLSILSTELRKQLGLALELRGVEDETNVESWNETIADAEALLCYGKLHAPLFDLSTRRNIPLALISAGEATDIRGMDIPPASLDRVYWDPASHLEQVLRHVVAKGAKRLAFVSSWNIERNHQAGFAVEAEAKIAEFQAFVAADAGLSGELFCPPRPRDASTYYEETNTYEFLREKDLRRLDAIVGHNDFVAQGIIAALRGQNLVPGRDTLVCGEGDYLECRHHIPTVTTVTYDKKYMADMVCSILRRRLADNRPRGEHSPVPSHIFERQSTGG